MPRTNRFHLDENCAGAIAGHSCEERPGGIEPMLSSTHIVARFRHMIGAPLRWPKSTTRRLMVLVAIVAVGIWAAMNVPQAIHRSIAYHQQAEYHVELEQRCKDMERESSTRARALQSDLDQWRRDTGSADQLTERYFVSRREFYISDAKYQREMATHHANLKYKYRRARLIPFVSVAPDPAPPADPLQSPPLEREPGKVYELISESHTCAAFPPLGNGLAVGCTDRNIRLLELPSRGVLATFPLPEGEPHAVAFSPDGTTIIAAGQSQNVWRWDVATGHAGRPLPWIDRSPGPPGPLIFASAVGFSPDAGTIAVAAGGFLRGTSKEIYSVKLFDARTGQLKREHNGSGSWPRSVAFSPDGGTLAWGSGSAMLLDTRSGDLTKTLKPVIGYVIAVAFSPDGRTLAGAGADTLAPGVGNPCNGRVTLWDVPTGKILRTLEGPTGFAQEVAFSPDGRMVAAGGRGPAKKGRDAFSGRRVSKNASEVRLWDIATGRMIWSVEGESNSAFSLAFSPHGTSLGFCDEDYVYIIDANTGRLKQIVMERISRFRVRGRLPVENR